MMQDSTRFFHGACSGLSCIHNSDLLTCCNVCLAFGCLIWLPLTKTCGFSEKKHTTRGLSASI